MKNLMRNSEFHQLFMEELKGIYWLENNWIATLKELEETALSDELKVTFRTHNLLNMEAVVRIEQAFELLGETVLLQRNHHLAEGLLKEVTQVPQVVYSEGMVRDAALIITVQKVVHYAIACYGSLVTLARLMDHEETERLLQLILADKKNSDAELTTLAENYVNLEAAKD